MYFPLTAEQQQPGLHNIQISDTCLHNVLILHLDSSISHEIYVF